MLIKNRRKIVFIAIVIFCMIAMYGFIPLAGLVSWAEAASLESAKDTLSDSSFNASSTHTIVFDMGDTNPLTAGQYVRVVFDLDFTTGLATSDIVCPTDTTASTTGQNVDCVVDAGAFLAATSTATTTIYGVTNPGTDGARDVTITTYTDADVEIETQTVKVYILDDITVTATVDATMSFAVAGLDAGTVVNNVTTTATTTATTTPFGTLSTAASSTVGQQLTVSTNADAGFTVTVQQDQELTSAAGSNINSFSNSPNGTGSTTHQTWAKPAGTLDLTHTYGHMGVTSEDSSFAGGNSFNVGSDPYYVGLNDTNTADVMYHDGPADGTTANKGLTQVAYTVEISSLQEAGDYTSTLTYICTPTY